MSNPGTIYIDIQLLFTAYHTIQQDNLVFLEIRDMCSDEEIEKSPSSKSKIIKRNDASTQVSIDL